MQWATIDSVIKKLEQIQDEHSKNTLVFYDYDGIYEQLGLDEIRFGQPFPDCEEFKHIKGVLIG